MDKILVTSFGVALIGFIYWFFFGKRDEVVQVIDSGQTIIVDGGYKPQVIRVQKDKDIDLTFLRKDDNSCLEEIIFPDFRVKEYLPLNKPTKVHINAKEAGTYTFHCGMNMYQGKLIVE